MNVNLLLEVSQGQCPTKTTLIPSAIFIQYWHGLSEPQHTSLMLCCNKAIDLILITDGFVLFCCTTDFEVTVGMHQGSALSPGLCVCVCVCVL